MAKQLIGVLVCSHEAKRGEKWGKMRVSPSTFRLDLILRPASGSPH